MGASAARFGSRCRPDARDDQSAKPDVVVLCPLVFRSAAQIEEILKLRVPIVSKTESAYPRRQQEYARAIPRWRRREVAVLGPVSTRFHHGALPSR